MRKSGFTLIELLAVIVILAIIALIAVPIVINIINDSKKESINRSIELYIDHAQKMIAKEQMKDPTFNPSECEIKPEGNLTCDGKTIQIEMKGQMPKSGKIKFSKGMVIEGINLELDNLYYQVKDDNISEGTKEKVTSYSDYITLEEDTGTTGLSVGDKYKYKVNDTDTFYFYVLSIEKDKVNLIMDRNICGSATEENASTNGTEATNENPCTIAWHSGANNNNYGPDTAMKGLYNATKNWTNVPNMDLSGENAYIDENNKTDSTKGYTGITTENGIAIITGKNNATNTVIGTTTQPLKARLPKESEVTSNDAGCHVWSSNSDYGSCNYFLVSNLYYNESEFNSYCTTCVTKYASNNGTGNIYGYWLLSSYPGTSYGARTVHYGGLVGNVNTSYASSYGVRAVITVSKSDLSN